MEKTAVEYLYKIIHARIHIDKDLSEYLEQAKEMEKHQIVDAFDSGLYDGGENVSNYNLAAEQYYNETFKLE